MTPITRSCNSRSVPERQRNTGNCHSSAARLCAWASSRNAPPTPCCTPWWQQASTSPQSPGSPPGGAPAPALCSRLSHRRGMYLLCRPQAETPGSPAPHGTVPHPFRTTHSPVRYLPPCGTSHCRTSRADPASMAAPCETGFRQTRRTPQKIRSSHDMPSPDTDGSRPPHAPRMPCPPHTPTARTAR